MFLTQQRNNFCLCELTSFWIIRLYDEYQLKKKNYLKMFENPERKYMNCKVHAYVFRNKHFRYSVQTLEQSISFFLVLWFLSKHVCALHISSSYSQDRNFRNRVSVPLHYRAYLGKHRFRRHQCEVTQCKHIYVRRNTSIPVFFFRHKVVPVG